MKKLLFAVSIISFFFFGCTSTKSVSNVESVNFVEDTKYVSSKISYKLKRKQRTFRFGFNLPPKL